MRNKSIKRDKKIYPQMSQIAAENGLGIKKKESCR